MTRPDDPAAGAFRAQLPGMLPDLRAFARFLVRDRTEADDLVQEALVRALAALDQFHPDSSARAWVFTILRNVFYEHARRRRREAHALQQGFPADEAAPPRQHGHSDVADLERALWKLSPLLREALVLVGAQGLSNEEAAAICNVPVGTIKARVSRARAQLARMHADAPDPVRK